jgi:hypothetical protein
MHDVINQLFTARDVAHKLHLKTKSFAKHLALGDFYEQLLEKTDEFAEVWQGKYGLVADIKGDLVEFNAQDPLTFISQFATWAESIKQFIDKNDTHILNVWDEIIALSYRAKYKIENLA